MGLSITSGITDLLCEAAQTDFSGKSLLMLGKQTIWINKVELYVIAKRLGTKINYRKLIANTTTMQGGGIDSYSFFYALGFQEVHAMDISPYESADIIFDLNQPNLPPELIGRFDYIVDGGTTEHVFNFAQALFNIAKMLKLNGKVFHYIPCCGSWINHGYYSLQPSLLRDFYNSNGFRIERLNVIMDSIKQTHSITNAFSTEPDFRVFNPRDVEDVGGYKGLLRCVAVKAEPRDVFTNPKQVQWYGLVNGDILQEMWAVDLDLENDDAAIGIFGTDNTSQVFLNVISSHPQFDRNKIKAFIVDDASEVTSFEGYPAIKAREIQTLGIKTIFLATFDNQVYEQLKPLESAGIKFVRLTDYRFALVQD